MLPEHKHSVNGRNNQGNNKITLDPIQKLPPQLSDNKINSTTTTTTIIPTDDDNDHHHHDTTATIIDFQTNLNNDINNDILHITTLGGSTPKKNHFATNRTNSNKINSIKSLSSNRKNHRQNHQQRKLRLRRFRLLSFQDNFIDNQHRRGRRLNGLQLPLHPLQVFGWIVLILFGLASFILLIPTFTIELQQPLYGLLAGLYIVHTISHLSALLIDPADRELRRVHRNDRIVPEFDRTKHSHVIENGRCHLCNIRTTSNRTKHCSVCNKCVGKFDHHCKWLNHCIGGRNYVAFLMCVVSAVIATLVILAAAIAQIVLFYLNSNWLNLWYLTETETGTLLKIETINDTTASQTTLLVNDTFLNTTPSSPSSSAADDSLITNFIDDTLGIFNQTLFVDENNEDDSNNNNNSNLTTIIAEAIVTAIVGNNDLNETNQIKSTTTSTIVESTATKTTGETAGGISLHDTIFLIFTGVLGVLAAITAGLLLHLCFFHIYISFLGLTTYEYIRNHRQNAVASNLPPTAAAAAATASRAQSAAPSLDLSSKLLKSKRNSQIYICSSLKHPNNNLMSNSNIPSDINDRPTTLHCCENSREYHQKTSLKTIYMCSLLEESTSTTTTTTNDHYINSNYHNGDDPQCLTEEKINNNSSSSQTFHCCSQFKKHQLNSNNDEIDSISMQRRRAAAAAILHFSEQCTFCTFRVKTPTKPESMTSSMQDKRCCLKTITKHHRWRRKWNCCSNVPDSPDVPNDIISTISTTIPTNVPNSIIYQQQQQHYHNRNGSSGNISTIKTILNDGQQQQLSSTNRVNLKTSRSKLVRPWPVTRFRHMLRMIGRYRRPRCRHPVGVSNFGSSNSDNIENVKQNQVRPIPHVLQQQHSSSSGDSDTASITSDSTIQSIETILPTSVIRDTIYMPTKELTMPTLPPPTRRKIPNPTDLDELAETLGFSQTPQQLQQKFPNSNSIYRRQRRKNFLRTRSPTLSPIHESGLSNPTSPQPCRHVTSSCAGTIVNNSCGTGGSSIIISSNGSRYGKR